MRKLLWFLPPLLFFALGALFYAGMGREDATGLPSTMIGRAAPPLPAATLPGVPGLGPEGLTAGEVTLVNFWATWCPPCRAEHPELLRLAREEGLRIVGVNIRDDAGKAAAYLAEEGNPFAAVAVDAAMRAAIDWGVTAPPETFILAPDGTVLHRFVGPLLGTAYTDRFRPALAQALR
jgi:cytochrome c biogenesis protein CcmG/thiol:disulfide interchange protein DsbE